MGKILEKFTVRALVALLLFVGFVAEPAEAAPANVSQMLSSLKLTDELPSSAYKRTYFKHWIDADKDGCDTRAEVLIEESEVPVKRKGKCTIVSGSWLSLYDNKKITLASKLDIDHLVPLSEAWKSGAFGWSAATRQAFANDLGVTYALVAVSANSNRSKGDKDPARWSPSYEEIHCNYIGSWIAQKYRWSLTIDTVEQRELEDWVEACGPAAEVDVPAVANAPAPLAPSKAKVSKIEVLAPTDSLAPGETVEIVLTAKDLYDKPLLGKIISFKNRDLSIQGKAPATDVNGRTAISVTIPETAKYIELITFTADLYGYGSYMPTIESIVVPSPSPTPTANGADSPAVTPDPAPTSAPGGATGGARVRARCKDGTLSYSLTRSGTCSGHGGVAVWYY